LAVYQLFAASLRGWRAPMGCAPSIGHDRQSHCSEASAMTIAATRSAGTEGRLVRVLAMLAVLSALGLAGCGSISDQTAASALVAPGKYDIYTCQDIEQRTHSTRARQMELEQLMTRAAQGAGGALVNAIAYRSEYLQTQGELEQLARSSAAKDCVSRSKWSSGRAVF
jgi:uncharacterized protein YceK